MNIFSDMNCFLAKILYKSYEGCVNAGGDSSTCSYCFPAVLGTPKRQTDVDSCINKVKSLTTLPDDEKQFQICLCKKAFGEMGSCTAPSIIYEGTAPSIFTPVLGGLGIKNEDFAKYAKYALYAGAGILGFMLIMNLVGSIRR